MGRAVAILRVQTLHESDEIFTVAGVLTHIFVDVKRLDRQPRIAGESKFELVVTVGGIVVAELEPRAASVIGDGRKRLQRVGVIGVPGEILHRSRSAWNSPSELVRSLLPVLLVGMTGKAT